jgi:hypothetical protein
MFKKKRLRLSAFFVSSKFNLKIHRKIESHGWFMSRAENLIFNFLMEKILIKF